MASPKASGRMIRKSVSDSEKIASLSPAAAVLFMMLIPHYNSHGKMQGGPGVVKDEVVPLIPYLTYENLPEYLQEISDKTNVKWFRCGNKWWLHSLHFKSEHQDLRADRSGEDTLPSFSDDKSGSSPGVVPEFSFRAEGFKVLREEEKLKEQQQQHACACDQLAEVVEERREDLQRLFPDCDIPVATAKLLAFYRTKPQRLLDPYLTAIKWFQREFKAAPLQAVARASPGSGFEQKSKALLREEANIESTQEALRLVKEMRNGQRRETAERTAGIIGYAGCRNDDGSTDAVSAGVG